MRILVGHNFYQQPGGEDNVFAAEASMLESYGHEVIRYTRHNDELNDYGRLQAGAVTLWNRQTAGEIRRLVADKRPDLCHFHNTFPLISPSVLCELKDLGFPVVLTLHNYRLICPGAVLVRAGRICEDCVGSRVPWRAAAHGCYRSSRTVSAGVTAMISVHHLLGTWKNTIDRYIALTGFARSKFIQGGWPAGKMSVKPNFLHPDPGVGGHQEHYALFVGRLSPEKGVATLLEAWKMVGKAVPLRIAGDGPLAEDVRRAATATPGISWLGPLAHEEIIRQMKRAAMLVFPSVWYEGLPLTVIESLATGLPVIASRLGSIPELVSHGKSGLLFEPGSAADLARSVLWMSSHPSEAGSVSLEARREFERKYTRARNYELLMECYESLLPARQREVQTVC